MKAWMKGFCSPRTHFINSAHIYNRPTCREQRLYGARLTFVYKTKIVPKKVDIRLLDFGASAVGTLARQRRCEVIEVLFAVFARPNGASDIICLPSSLT